MKTFSECAICQHWSPLNKKWSKDVYYCPIHYKREEERARSIRFMKKGEEFLTFLRRVKEVNIS